MEVSTKTGKLLLVARNNDAFQVFKVLTR